MLDEDRLDKLFDALVVDGIPIFLTVVVIIQIVRALGRG